MKVIFNYRNAIILLFIAGIFLEIWKIWEDPVKEWDEARRGINAIGSYTYIF